MAQTPDVRTEQPRHSQKARPVGLSTWGSTSRRRSARRSDCGTRIVAWYPQPEDRAGQHQVHDRDRNRDRDARGHRSARTRSLRTEMPAGRRAARLPAPVVEQLIRLGLFRLWIPRRYGGLQRRQSHRALTRDTPIGATGKISVASGFGAKIMQAAGSAPWAGQQGQLVGEGRCPVQYLAERPRVQAERSACSLNPCCVALLFPTFASRRYPAVMVCVAKTGQ